MTALAPLFVRLRRSSLSVKLAALGAAVTAAVVVVAFWGLSVETRRNTERVFTGQLERNQRTLHQLQDRSAREMLVTARLISKAPHVSVFSQDLPARGQSRRRAVRRPTCARSRTSSASSRST